MGATTPIAAANLLLNSGLNASFADNNTSLQFDHAWLQARFSAGGAWMPLDPTWKFQSHRDQPQNMLTSVTFDPDPRTGGYFAEAKTEMASEYYEDQVRNWLAANQPGTTVADVAYRGPILTQVIAALPTALPFAVVGSPTYQSSIPDNNKNRVRVSLWNYDPNTTDHRGTTEYFVTASPLSVPDICLQALTIRPTVSGSNVVPTLLENLQTTVCQSNTALASGTSVVVMLEHLDGDGDANSDRSYTFVRKAGDYIAISLDANQISSDLVQSQYRVANTANINYLNNSASFNLDSNIGSPAEPGRAEVLLRNGRG